MFCVKILVHVHLTAKQMICSRNKKEEVQSVPVKALKMTRKKTKNGFSWRGIMLRGQECKRLGGLSKSNSQGYRLKEDQSGVPKELSKMKDTVD